LDSRAGRAAKERRVNKNPARRPLAGRHDQRRQIGSLRKKKNPALVSGAEDSFFVPP
jgi:hypothetical protein